MKLDSSSAGFEDIGKSIRGTLTKAMKASPLSRYQVAARISELMEREISFDMLNKYCAETSDHRFPAELVPAVVQEDVTGQVTFDKGTFFIDGKAITVPQWADGTFEAVNDGTSVKILRRV